MFDVWVFFFFGMLGFVMNKLEFSPLPLILGLILGRMAEKQLEVGLAISKGSMAPFFLRPVSGLLLLGAVVSIALPPIMDKMKAKKLQVAQGKGI